MLPIWQDYTVSLETTPAQDSVAFTVDVNGTQVYEGTAYKRPGQTYPSVRINDIVAPFLSQKLPTLSNDDDYPVAAETFDGIASVDVRWSDNGTPKVDSEDFFYDWSYDRSLIIRAVLTLDTFGGTPEGFPILATLGDTAGDTYEVKGYSVSGTLLETESVSDAASNVSCLGVTGSGKTGRLDIIIDGDLVKSIKAVKSCAPAALYFVNAYGGWDCLPLVAVKKAATLSRDEYTSVYDNADPAARGRHNYRNEVAWRWELKTGWLTDAQYALSHHYLASTLVYLYTVADGFTPVVLTNSEVEERTYRSEGGNMSQLTITAEVAKEFDRK